MTATEPTMEERYMARTQQLRDVVEENQALRQGLEKIKAIVAELENLPQQKA